MHNLLNFILRSVLGLVALALVGIIGFGLYIYSRYEAIPDFSVQPKPVIRTAAPAFAEAIRASRLDMEAIRRAKYYPSMSISVVRRGEEVWSEAVGYEDLKTRKSATPDTLYPSGSIAKALTGVLAMQLASEGVVDLDAPINLYATDLPTTYEGVTLRQLLSHQAGVRHYKATLTPPYFSENGLNREFGGVGDSLSIFIDDELLFEPDASFQYSTFGYTLASYVLEKATGVSFLDLIRDRLLNSISADQIVPDRSGRPNPNRTTDYISALQNVGVFRSPPTNVSYKWAGGGFLSSPSALAQFGDLMLRGEILDAPSIAEMTTPRRMANGEINPQRYGIGWRVSDIRLADGVDTIPVYHHGGTAVGAECALLLAPSFDLSISICGNAFTGGSGDLIRLARSVARHIQHDALLQESNDTHRDALTE